MAHVCDWKVVEAVVNAAGVDQGLREVIVQIDLGGAGPGRGRCKSLRRMGQWRERRWRCELGGDIALSVSPGQTCIVGPMGVASLPLTSGW